MMSRPSLSNHSRWNAHSSARRSLGVALVALAFISLTADHLSAQFVVYDAATTARNAVTATLKEYLYQTQVQQHTKIREMARRLSALTSLRKYSLTDVPRWRTHGGDFFYAQPYNDALIFGDPTGTAFVDLSLALVNPSGLLNRLDAVARRAVEARLATVNLADATAIAGTHDTGQLRFFGRKSELPAIDALERDVIEPSTEQSTTAVLDKISGASIIGAKQRQARVQLLTGMLEQLLIDSKRTRDTDAAALDMQLVTWRDGRAAAEAFRAGTGDALRTWRQP